MRRKHKILRQKKSRINKMNPLAKKLVRRIINKGIVKPLIIRNVNITIINMKCRKIIIMQIFKKTFIIWLLESVMQRSTNININSKYIRKLTCVEEKLMKIP